MNETLHSIISFIVGFFVGAFMLAVAKLFGKRGADTNSERIEELEQGAAEDNRALGEEERRTDTILEDQAEDNRRSGETNRRINELIQRAEEILKGKSSD